MCQNQLNWDQEQFFEHFSLFMSHSGDKPAMCCQLLKTRRKRGTIPARSQSQRSFLRFLSLSASRALKTGFFLYLLDP
jgi:hypothetical protein